MPTYSKENSTKKFLLIASFADSIIKFRGYLIKELIQNQIEVHVCAPGLDHTSKTRALLLDMGAKVHEVPLQRTGQNPIADIRYFLSLIRVIRLIKPDFVLNYTIKPVIFGTLASKLLKVPNRTNMITGLGYMFVSPKKSWLSRPVMALYKRALNFSHLVIFQNPDDHALLKTQKLLNNKTRTTIVNGSGINLEEYSLAPLPTETHFLLIARLLVSKGIREYVDAARIVKQKHPNITFSLAGWIDTGPDAIEQEELNSWIEEGTVNYLGYLEDVRDAIKNCNVYVLPSYREGTPRTVLEAMAMGRAIITTDAPGCRETVEENINGFKVPVGKAEPIVKAMLALIENPLLISKFAQQSRVISQNKYDVTAVNKKMLDSIGI